MMLRCKDINKSFGPVRVLQGVSLDFLGPELVALIGPNGAGKTTLVDIISGFVSGEPGGSCWFRDQDVLRLRPYEVARLGISRTFQEVRVIPSLTVTENVLLA